MENDGIFCSRLLLEFSSKCGVKKDKKVRVLPNSETYSGPLT